jgi:hypothetical protein
MADYPISNVPRRVQYVNSGVGPYAFTFAVLVQTDIAVYRGNTLLTLTTDYTVTINANGTGSVTLVTAGTGNITIVGARAIQRTSDYTTGGDLFASTLNVDLDSQTIFSQQLAESISRTVSVPITDASTLDMQLPTSSTRANKLFGFSSNGSPTVSTNTIAAVDAAVNTISSIAGAPAGSSAGISHISAGSGAVATTVQAKLRESVSVKDFGAIGDGTADDTAAIVAADAYAASSQKSLYFSPGTYLLASLISMTAKSWYGDSSETSIIKLQTGSTVTNLVHVGPTSGTSIKTFCSIENIKFDGNNGCSSSVVGLRNVQHSSFRNLKVTNGSNHGFTTNTSTASINTQILRNEYTNIVSYENDGAGFLFVGEKDSRFDNLFSRNNGSDGFVFRAFKDDANQLAETTTCTITSLLSRDNAGNGFIFDMVEKYVAGSIESTINGGAGFQFNSTVTGASGNGSNSLICGSMISRNDAQGAFRMSNTAYVYGLKIGSLIAYGFGSTINYPGIIVYGGSSISFGSVLIQGFKSTAVYIQAGNPFGGGTVQSNNIHFDLLKLTGNGDAAASANAGLVILDNSFDITINNLISSNLQTNATTGEYELGVSATSGPVNIGYARLTAATAGYEENIGLSETYITTYKRRSDAAALTLIDGVTAPGTNLANHAQIYIDTADGDLKIRFADGTVKTIVTDS